MTDESEISSLDEQEVDVLKQKYDQVGFIFNGIFIKYDNICELNFVYENFIFTISPL